MNKKNVCWVVWLCLVLVMSTMLLNWCTKKQTWTNDVSNIIDETSIESTTSDTQEVKDNTENAEENAEETAEIEDNNKNNYKWYYEYENKLYNFSIEIPGNWTFMENEFNFAVLVYTPEDWWVRENLGVSVQTPQIATDLETYYSESMKKIAEISEWFNEINSTDIEVNWLNGKSTVYETVQNDTNVKSQQTVFIDKNNYVYILQYTATKDTFNNYSKEIDYIIKSFKILN